MASILIIDPNHAVRQALAEELKELSNGLYEVTHADNYDRAMGFIGGSLQRTPYDIICIDSYIGDKPGRIVLDRIRRHAAYRDTPVVGGYIEVNVWQVPRDKAVFAHRKRTRTGEREHFWNAEDIQTLLPLPASLRHKA